MSRFLSIVLGIALAAGAAVPAIAGPLPALAVEAPSLVVPVQANCHAVGQQIAAQHGGRLADASLEQRGGQSVCVIVVLVPGRDGQRPSRETIVVPQ